MEAGRDRAGEHRLSVLVGARLRVVRDELGMSLEEVERKSEGQFHASTMGMYERGDRALLVSHLYEIARFYGVDPTYLLPLDDERFMT